MARPLIYNSVEWEPGVDAMRQQGKNKQEVLRRAKGICRHYWKIEEANGPRSQGVCQYCGKARYFLNYIPVSSQSSNWARIAGSKPRRKG
jgi:hypothetical protein